MSTFTLMPFSCFVSIICFDRNALSLYSPLYLWYTSPICDLAIAFRWLMHITEGRANDKWQYRTTSSQSDAVAGTNCIMEANANQCNIAENATSARYQYIVYFALNHQDEQIYYFFTGLRYTKLHGNTIISLDITQIFLYCVHKCYYTLLNNT